MRASRAKVDSLAVAETATGSRSRSQSSSVRSDDPPRRRRIAHAQLAAQERLGLIHGVSADQLFEERARCSITKLARPWHRGGPRAPWEGSATGGATQGPARGLAEESVIVVGKPAEVKETPAQGHVGDPGVGPRLEQVLPRGPEPKGLDERLRRRAHVLAERGVERALRGVQRGAEIADGQGLRQVLSEPGLRRPRQALATKRGLPPGAKRDSNADRRAGHQGTHPGLGILLTRPGEVYGTLVPRGRGSAGSVVIPRARRRRRGSPTRACRGRGPAAPGHLPPGRRPPAPVRSWRRQVRPSRSRHGIAT